MELTIKQLELRNAVRIARARAFAVSHDADRSVRQDAIAKLDAAIDALLASGYKQAVPAEMSEYRARKTEGA